jgi:hypothetical protein
MSEPMLTATEIDARMGWLPGVAGRLAAHGLLPCFRHADTGQFHFLFTEIWRGSRVPGFGSGPRFEQALAGLRESAACVAPASSAAVEEAPAPAPVPMVEPPPEPPAPPVPERPAPPEASALGADQGAPPPRAQQDDARVLAAVRELSPASSPVCYTQARTRAQLNNTRMRQAVARLVGQRRLMETTTVTLVGNGAMRQVRGLRLVPMSPPPGTATDSRP